MNFSSELANEEKLKEFEGALPTTIYQAGFSEVYGQSPDIDSTALMLSTTSWILTRTLKEEEEESHLRDLPIQPIIAAEHSSDYVSALLSKVGITDPSKVTDFVIPKMLKAIFYLSSRDKDNDGLLEQDHNEDWMDTVLRSGKIVYSQACWLLALTDFAALLIKVGREEDAQKLMTSTIETIQAVEEKLWSDNHGSYVDIQKNHDFEEPYRMLTQDISLYLVAITQNMITKQNKKVNEIQEIKDIQHDHYIRAISTFDTMRSRLWNENWPLITEAELKASGPWTLKQYEYHNQTFWPWISGIEMLARGRFNRIEECNILLSKIATKRPHIPAFYEWINPITHQPSGAFPFRTGISSIRLALFDIICTNNRVSI
jgi:glycogen debranching enzyme